MTPFDGARAARFFVLATLLAPVLACVRVASSPAADVLSPWDRGPAVVTLRVQDALVAGHRWSVRVSIDGARVDAWPQHPVERAQLPMREHELTCVVVDRDAPPGARELAFHRYFSVASGCVTEIDVGPRVDEGQPARMTLSESVTCNSGLGAVMLIPEARALAAPPVSEGAAALRRYVAACDALAEDATRYLEEAVTIARTAKDVIVLVGMRDYLTRVAQARARLREAARIDDDADAATTQRSFDVARARCESVRDLQNQARRAVAAD